MTYLSWSAFHEGPTDALYFEVLIPRLMEAIIIADGIGHSDIPTAPAIKLGKNGRDLDEVAAEICASKNAFEIVFIHADTGGRALEEKLDNRSVSYCRRAYDLCEWPPLRCITVAPRHETEAWILADPTAVVETLGYSGNPSSLGLPTGASAAERLPDPKAILAAAMKQTSGNRRRTMKIDQLFPAIAQRQSFPALRRSNSFLEFERCLRSCLSDLGCISV